MLIPRNLKTPVVEASTHMRVLLVNGARQTGKSTLVRGLFEADQTPAYISLDDVTTLGVARSSPKSFVDSFTGPVIIDEIQRAPELLLPIKQRVDKERKAGQFFLTGSANVLTLPKLADSLAGRMGIYTLWPLSQGELLGVQESFIDTLFSDNKLELPKSSTAWNMLSSIISGGYPDVTKLSGERQRTTWFRSYLTTILERDVRELSNIEGLTSLPDLLTLIASRPGRLLNIADWSRTLQLPASTLKRYLTLLQAVYMVVPLRAWSANLDKRLTKSPKIYLNDTGLLCHLLDLDENSLEKDRTQLGTIFENFVVMELTKQLAWSDTQAKMFHFRTASGQEVDIILEAGRRIIGIECKSSPSVGADDFEGLHALQELAGRRFHRGIILYTGTQYMRFGEQLELVPISALWQTSTSIAPALTEPVDG
jgi:predicted AAA+ superfamily ATPase